MNCTKTVTEQFAVALLAQLLDKNDDENCNLFLQVVDMGIVVEVISQLEIYSITKEALEVIKGH